MKRHQSQHIQGGPAAARPARPAFTMIEMIVVVGMILLLSAVAVPSFVQLFSSGANAQAYNMVSAQMMTARNVAIERGQYAGLHFQRPDATKGPFRQIRGDFEYFGYCGVVVGTFNPATSALTLDVSPGFAPKPMPGHMSMIDLDQTTYTDPYRFTTGTILFNPNGSLLGQANIKTYLTTPSMFVDPNTTAIWQNLAATSSNGTRIYPPCKNPGLVSLDDYMLVYSTLTSTGDINTFLNNRTESIFLNYNTGLLMPRK